MKKLVAIVAVLAILLSVSSVYACDRPDCRNAKLYSADTWDCRCPGYDYVSPCVCIECEYCKDQFVQPVETAYLESAYYADYAELATYRVAAQDYTVVCRRLNVRADASTKNARIDVLTRGAKVQVLSIENGWAKIVRADGSEAYVFAKYIRKV